MCALAVIAVSLNVRGLGFRVAVVFSFAMLLLYHFGVIVLVSLIYLLHFFPIKLKYQLMN